MKTGHQKFLAAVRNLRPCSPWSLDQLERYLWVLTSRRQLQRFSLLGAWVTAPEQFVCVLEHHSMGAVGMVVQPDGAPDPNTLTGGPTIDASLWAAAERVVHLDVPRVQQWRERGWEKDGITWSSDPTGLRTPWSGQRPPGPADTLLSPQPTPYWSVQTPSVDPDPGWAAVEDTRRWAEQSTWASTVLTRTPLHHEGAGLAGLRWAAGWAVSADCYAHIEAFVWSEDSSRLGSELRGRHLIPDEAALPGQRYLRIGEVVPARSQSYDEVLQYRFIGLAVDSKPPQSALAFRVARGGVAWQDTDDPIRTPAAELGAPYLRDHRPFDEMADILHHALDQPS